MTVFEYSNYKKYLNDWISIQPKKGHGILRKMATQLSVHTTMLSHTIRGSKDLTVEQAFSLSEFIGMNKMESDYFLLLVQMERAGTHKLKIKYKNDLMELKKETQDLKKRVRTDLTLNEEEKAIFYSSWIYAALRQLSSLKEYQTRQKLLDAFPLKKNDVNAALDFLIATRMCEEKGNDIKIGPAKTHVAATSPFVFLHHKNWRLKALEKQNNLASEELMYSAPFTISESDFLFLREKIVQFIELFIHTADKTKNERLACLNIDLFFVK